MDSSVLRRIGLAVLVVALAAGADWPCFRGPDGTGVSADKNLPEKWSATQGVVWKTALPGPGASSPIVVGDKIFVTSYSDYGLSADEPGDVEKLMLHVLCVDRASGKVVWDKTHKAGQPEKAYGGFIGLHGYASSTPTSDGQNVYVFFGHTGVFAYSLDGQLKWQANVGDKTHAWGSATSPVVTKDLVIINASVESGKVFGLSKTDGKVVWEVPGIDNSWSSPLLVATAKGHELVVQGKNIVWGLDPASGKKLWECKGVEDYTCPSLVAHNGVVYVTAGREKAARILAVKAGGSGNVTETQRLWDLPKKASKVGTPLYYEGYLYWVDHRGIAFCVDAQKGQVVYEEKLTLEGPGDKVYASLVLGEGKLYGVSRQGGAFVLAVGPQFKLLAQNDLGDKSVFNATPVIDRGQLLLRSDKFLYCIGK
jgi:outer membrane protein assembly factor BamB